MFPSFLMSGFECASFWWKDGERKDYLHLTGHDRKFEEDYAFLRSLGIRVIREGVAWPLVDLGSGRYRFELLDAMLASLREYELTPIWDLCHFGLPDGCDPFDATCVGRFVFYCRAVAERVQRELPPPHCFTPVNEISFFADAGSWMGWFYPFAADRRDELLWALCRLAIEGAKAIRSVIPAARMVHPNPVIHLVAPPGRPDLSDEAYRIAYEGMYEAWDILAGRRCPELGGGPEILDIIGVNTYGFSQGQLNPEGSREILARDDPRRRCLRELIAVPYRRYHRPIMISETSGAGEERAAWLDAVMDEALEARKAGVDLQGVCLYPAIDIPDWNSGEWAHLGLCEVDPERDLARRPVAPYQAAIRRWQEQLSQEDDRRDV